MDRRSFLKNSAVGGTTAAAATLAAPAYAQGNRTLTLVTTWPRGLAGVHDAAQRAADNITAMSDGQLTVDLKAAGELVGAFEVFDAVTAGQADMYHGADYYFIGQHPGYGFYASVPFGMTAVELATWYYHDGGMELHDELGQIFGLKSFLAGNTGAQCGGWFRKQINGPEDLQGLRFRMPGQGGQALTKLGVSVQNLPGGEIYQALSSGALDGTEWIGPWSDQAAGFQEITNIYYTAGFHEPGPGLSLATNREVFESLTPAQQKIIQITAGECHQWNLDSVPFEQWPGPGAVARGRRANVRVPGQRLGRFRARLRRGPAGKHERRVVRAHLRQLYVIDAVHSVLDRAYRGHLYRAARAHHGHLTPAVACSHRGRALGGGAGQRRGSLMDAIVWVVHNILRAFWSFAFAVTHPDLWLDWSNPEAIFRFIYYGGSVEFFFVVFVAFLILTAVGLWRNRVMWAVVRGLEGFANGLGRFFAWAGLLMVLQQIIIVFSQRIFSASELTLGVGVALTYDISWWSEELKLYNAMIVALCCTWTFVQGGHVRVDLVYSGVSYRTKRVIDMLGSLLFMMPFAVLVWMYSWYFMWRHLVTPKVSASDRLEQMLMKARAFRWNVETIGFSPMDSTDTSSSRCSLCSSRAWCSCRRWRSSTGLFWNGRRGRRAKAGTSTRTRLRRAKSRWPHQNATRVRGRRCSLDSMGSNSA